MTEILLQVDVQERTIESAAEEATVLVHDDGLTPLHHMMLVLRTTFELSDELAEHIAWVAQATGTAPVVTRPRPEARRLVHQAHVTARLYGAPLTFSLEQEPSTPPQESRKPLIPFVVSGIILLCALLLAVSLAFADGAGDTCSPCIEPPPFATTEPMHYNGTKTNPGVIVDWLAADGVNSWPCFA